MASMNKVREIVSSINIDEIGAEYSFIGVRVQEEAYGLNVGDVVTHNSHIWDDGDDTGVELDGISAMSIDRLNAIRCEYYGSTVIILGSDYAEYGEDIGEIVMQDAQVLAIVNF